MAEGMGRKAVNRGLNGRRCDQIRLIAVTPGVQDLQGNFPAFPVNGVSDHAMMRQLAGVVQHRTAFHPHARGRRGHPAGNNQRYPVTCALGIEGRQTFGPVRMFFKPGMH